MIAKVIIGLFLGLGSIYAQAETLQSVVGHVLDTNPALHERLKNYETKKAEIAIDEAGYYPTVNLESAVGRKATGRIDSDGIHQSYNVFQHSLRLRQNIFDGFSTQERVNYRKMLALSAAYNYLDKSNDTALQAVTAYIDLQKEKALLKNAESNVKHNTATYHKIKKSHDAGLTAPSEVSKIYSTLSLAKSNLMLQKSKLLNAQSNFRRITGLNIDINTLQKVNFDLKLPRSQKKAEAYALDYNPSIVAGNYNLKGIEALYRESMSAFYPKVALELSQNYNDNYNEFVGTDDRAQALVILSYNLYNGGADEAKKVSALSKVHQETSVIHDMKRQVTQGVELSWNAYKLALEQLPFLKQYKKQSQETLTLFHEEYALGNRTLLDLISAENDLKRANDELIYAQYNLLQAKYGIMHSMGLTVASILGDQSQYYHRVGIRSLHRKHAKQSENPYKALHKAMKKDSMKPVSKSNKGKPAATDKPHAARSPKPTQVETKDSTSFFDSFTKIRWESR